MKIIVLLVIAELIVSCRSTNRAGYRVKETPQAAAQSQSSDVDGLLSEVQGSYTGKSLRGEDCKLDVYLEESEIRIVDSKIQVPIHFSKNTMADILKSKDKKSIDAGSATCPVSLTNGQKKQCHYSAEFKFKEGKEVKIESISFNGSLPANAGKKLTAFNIFNCNQLVR